jgi:hypothetical protein
MSKYSVVNLVWNGEKNVCIHCGGDTVACYIATGHDHTDERADMCVCGGGIAFKDWWHDADIKNPTHDIEFYVEYL